MSTHIITRVYKPILLHKPSLLKRQIAIVVLLERIVRIIAHGGQFSNAFIYVSK